MKKILFLLLGVMGITMLSGCYSCEDFGATLEKDGACHLPTVYINLENSPPPTETTTTATLGGGISFERCSSERCSSPHAIADDWKGSIYFYSASFICFPTPQGKKMFEDNFKKIMVKENFQKYACQGLEQRQDFCVNDYKTTYTDCLARLEKKYIDCSARREVKIEQMAEEAKNLK